MTEADKNSKKMETLGRMTRGLVHDFNNSLASIMGYADFLISDLPPDSEQYVFAENIKKSGLQLQDLIDQIRALSAEKNNAKDPLLNLVELTEDITARLQGHFGSKQKLIFTSDIAGAAKPIPLFQFKTLLTNLILNAVEALQSREGQVNVHISLLTSDGKEALLNSYDSFVELERFHPTASFITIQISDNGCGMDQITLNQAHSPHFTTKSSDAAHGMGLSVAREITSYLEGGFIIASSEGIGTHVLLTIPVEQIEGKLQDSPATSKKSVLLIEDRETVLHTVATMLQRQHHHVDAVTDPLIALDMLREAPDFYDVLITDYTMPHLNGRALLDEIREDFETLPVILMSGDMEYLNKLKGDQTYKHIFILHKPVTVQNLKRVLQSATQKT